jgi:uncharacterized membrane protein YedE/YeeE
MPEKKVLATISVPGAAIIIGALLLLTCLAAPLYSAPRVVWLVQLLLGMFGLLCVVLGLLGARQERLLMQHNKKRHE